MLLMYARCFRVQSHLVYFSQPDSRHINRFFPCTIAVRAPIRILLQYFPTFYAHTYTDTVSHMSMHTRDVCRCLIVIAIVAARIENPTARTDKYTHINTLFTLYERIRMWT